MKTNLHPITKEYSLVLVPMDAYAITIFESHKGNFYLNYFTKSSPHILSKPLSEDGIKMELIGHLSSISEEKAREIVKSFPLPKIPRIICYVDYMATKEDWNVFETALESLRSLILSLGIKKEGFKEIIIKH